jgi:hypothetical protein
MYAFLFLSTSARLLASVSHTLSGTCTSFPTSNPSLLTNDGDSPLSLPLGLIIGGHVKCGGGYTP